MYSSNQPKHVSCREPWQQTGAETESWCLQSPPANAEQPRVAQQARAGEQLSKEHHQGQRPRSGLCTASLAASQGQALLTHWRPVAGCTAFPRGPAPATAVSEDALKRTASLCDSRLDKCKSKDDFKHPTV